LAFLGAVIVSPELRGKGAGKQMMETALDYLRSTGVRTVRLNAYLNAIPFYERLGFQREYEVIRWTGSTATGRARGVRPLRLVAAAGTTDVAFSGPSTNEALLEFVRDRGFEEVFRALRMRWGADEFAGDPRGVWALGGLEKG